MYKRGLILFLLLAGCAARQGCYTPEFICPGNFCFTNFDFVGECK